MRNRVSAILPVLACLMLTTGCMRVKQASGVGNSGDAAAKPANPGIESRADTEPVPKPPATKTPVQSPKKQAAAPLEKPAPNTARDPVTTHRSVVIPGHGEITLPDGRAMQPGEPGDTPRMGPMSLPPGATITSQSSGPVRVASGLHPGVAGEKETARARSIVKAIYAGSMASVKDQLAPGARDSLSDSAIRRMSDTTRRKHGVFRDVKLKLTSRGEDGSKLPMTVDVWTVTCERGAFDMLLMSDAGGKVASIKLMPSSGTR